MKLEEQVVSLELAKKLKELGVKQDGLFQWFRQFPGDDYLLHYIDYNHHEMDLKIFKEHFPDSCSAFTVAELGEMLPTGIYIDDSSEKLYLRCIKYPDAFNISYFDHDDKWFNWVLEIDQSEADSRARMLIFLIENGYISTNSSRSLSHGSGTETPKPIGADKV